MGTSYLDPQRQAILSAARRARRAYQIRLSEQQKENKSKKKLKKKTKKNPKQ